MNIKDKFAVLDLLRNILSELKSNEICEDLQEDLIELIEDIKSKVW